MLINKILSRWTRQSFIFVHKSFLCSIWFWGGGKNSHGDSSDVLSARVFFSMFRLQGDADGEWVGVDPQFIGVDGTGSGLRATVNFSAANLRGAHPAPPTAPQTARRHPSAVCVSAIPHRDANRKTTVNESKWKFKHQFDRAVLFSLLTNSWLLGHFRKCVKKNLLKVTVRGTQNPGQVAYGMVWCPMTQKREPGLWQHDTVTVR